jgi:hypothetical protein
MTLSSTVLDDIPSTTDLVELLPAGAIIAYGTAPGSAPAGFLFCRGQLVTKATYPNLNAVIGDGPGSGNPGYHGYNNGVDPGSGNMRMPNLQNASPLGAGPSSGVARGGTNGAVVGGARPHSHGAGTLNLPVHSHTSGTLIVAGHTHGHTLAMGSHDHSLTIEMKTIFAAADVDLYLCHYSSTEGGPSSTAFTGSVTAASTLAVTGSTANSSAASVTGTSDTSDGPYLVVNFLIKT